MGLDYGRVPSWETWLIKSALNELIEYFDLLSLFPLSQVRFLSNRGQTWLGSTVGQDIGRICSWETWLIEWVLNELIDYFDLLSLLPLSRVRFFSDCGQTWEGRTVMSQDLSQVHSLER